MRLRKSSLMARPGTARAAVAPKTRWRDQLRGLMVVGLIGMLAGLGASPAVAAKPAPAPDMAVATFNAAWRDWLARNRISVSQIAVSYKGHLLLSEAVGTITGQPQTVMSLSKTITGACINQLVRSGKLRYDMPLTQILQDAPGRYHGLRVPDVTIAQLLTHHSGLSPDRTQGRFRSFMGRRKDDFDPLLKLALDRWSQGGDRDRFFYNNGNYAILGAVIQKVTGRDYESYCRSAVLAPYGVTSASLSPTWGATSSFAGWQITMADLTRFARGNFGGGSDFYRRMGAYPVASTGRNGILYSTGIEIQPGGPGGVALFHTGQVEMDDLTLNRSAYLVQYGPDLEIAVSYDGSIERGGLKDLMQALYYASTPLI